MRLHGSNALFPGVAVIAMVAMAATLMLLACGQKDASLAGGTTTETEAAIIGVLKNPDGKAAVGARIRIRPVGYLAGPDSSAYPDLIADAQGRIQWTAKTGVLYNLEADSGLSLGTFIREISPGKESRNLIGVLDTVGSLDVRLLAPAPGVTYVLRVYGMERYVTADSLGRFRISLPAGDFRVAITGSAPTVTPMVLDSVHIDRGKTRLIDSLRLPALDSALIGYWPFEEGSGEIIGDASGHGLTGHMKGASWVPGKAGGAIRFINGQGYVDLGAATVNLVNFRKEDDFTFAAWVKPGNPIPNRGVARRIISRQKKGAASFFLRIFPDSHPGFASHPVPAPGKISAAQGPATNDLKAPVNLGDGGWHHVVGIQKQNRVYVFVDGKERAASSRDSLVTVTTYIDYDDKSPLLYPDPGMDGHLVIGCVESGIDGFDGSIDEVRVYGRALTPQEVYQLASPFNEP